MAITFAPRGMLQVDDARIAFGNFSGRGDKFNREGDRNFSLVIENEEDAQRLQEAGWNVKIKAPREEGDLPFMHMKVKVKFSDYGPRVILMTEGSTSRVVLNEETIGCLDNIDIARIDMDIRPFKGDMNGVPFQSAYLETMYVTQKYNRFIDRYGE